MIKEYRDILFESGAINKLTRLYIHSCRLEKEILEDSETKVSIIPESEVNIDTDPQTIEFISKRFNFPDDH